MSFPWGTSERQVASGGACIKRGRTVAHKASKDREGVYWGGKVQTGMEWEQGRQGNCVKS